MPDKVDVAGSVVGGLEPTGEPVVVGVMMAMVMCLDNPPAWGDGWLRRRSGDGPEVVIEDGEAERWSFRVG